MLNVCCCYAHEDEEFLKKLEKHLAPLRKGMGVFDLWSAYEIEAGMDWKHEMEEHLRHANIILLLVSPDFIASDLCYSLGMQQVIERQQKGGAVVIPIILRSVLWQVTPLGKLQALPRNNRPIALWRDRDAAFLSVASEIWVVITNLIEEGYKRLGATNKDLNEARSGIIRKNFEFEQALLPENHFELYTDTLEEKDYKIYSKHIRSLEMKRRRLLHRAKWIFIKRKVFNKIKYAFKRSYREEREAILENEEFLRMYNQILGLKEI